MLDKVWFPLSLTLWVATISSVLVLCTGIIIAYVFARRDFWGKELAELLVTLPLVLPPTVIGYLLVIFVGRKGLLGHFIYNFFWHWDHVYLAGSSHCGLYSFPSSYGESCSGSH